MWVSTVARRGHCILWSWKCKQLLAAQWWCWESTSTGKHWVISPALPFYCVSVITNWLVWLACRLYRPSACFFSSITAVRGTNNPSLTSLWMLRIRLQSSCPSNTQALYPLTHLSLSALPKNSFQKHLFEVIHHKGLMLKEGIGASKNSAYNNLLFIITTIVSLDNTFLATDF